MYKVSHRLVPQLYPPRGAEQNVDDGYVLEKIAVGGSLPLPGVELRTSLDKRWSGTRVC